MKQTRLASLIILISVIGIVLINSAYIIDETEQVVITQFGEPIGNPIRKPGLHWKVPVLHVIHRFEKRILEWDGYPSEVPTRDKKFIWVDVTGRWRIQDPLVFLKTMHNERNAQSRLDDIMDGVTRDFITSYKLPDIVRSTNDILEKPLEDEDMMAGGEFEKIEVGRDTITRQILENAREKVEGYGIELIDLRIKRINYIQSVQRKVFERMVSERKRAAQQLRSEGEGVRAEIEGKRQRELKRIQSEAYKTAQEIKGKADATATKVYGDAYNNDPGFYAFTATLERYPETLKNSRLILTTESDFLSYIKELK